MMPFNKGNTHMNNVHTAIPNGLPPVPQHRFPSPAVNHQQIVQNGFMGIPQNVNQIQPLPQHGPIDSMAQNQNQVVFMQSHGQFLPPNYPQNVNQIMLGGCLHSQNLNPNMHLPSVGQFCAHGLAQNVNPMMGLPNCQLILQSQMQNFNQNATGHCLQHPVGHANFTHFNTNSNSQPPFLGSSQIPHMPCFQNPNFLVNPQFAMANSIVNPTNLAVSNEPIKYNNQDPNTVSQPIMGQKTMQESFVAVKQLGGSLLPSLTVGPAQVLQSEKNVQPSGFSKQQGNDIQGGNNNALYTNQGNVSNNFNRNLHGRGRFQKSQFHNMSNVEGKFMQTTSNRGKGNWNKGDGKPHFAYPNKKASLEFKRSFSVTYTEEEIQQWREERRKNFPSKANIKKKLVERNENSDISNANAKIRSQQLKEILAKQAELGVEVAEIPPNYFSDAENQVGKRENLKMEQSRKGRLRNKYNKRSHHIQDNGWAKKQKLEGDVEVPEIPPNSLTDTENHVGKRENLKMEHYRKGRFRNKHDKRLRHGQDNGWSKKQKLEGGEPPRPSTSTQRTTTLLEKLLSADIKRDKSRLLQVFRFMVMNSFFKSYPEKPLEFPLITAKDAGLGEGFVNDQGSQHKGDAAVSGLITSATAEFKHPQDFIAEGDNENSDSNDNGDGDQDTREEMVDGYVYGKDCVEEGIEKSDAEEGEITD